VTQLTQQHHQRPLSDQASASSSSKPAEEIFLTPRVIDRRSFETYAASLRQSLEETSRESDLLARRAEAAAVVLERLERFVGSHGDVFDRAGQLIESIDDRQESTGELLSKLARMTESAKQASRDIESLIRERSEAFEQRLITLATDALDKFEVSRDSLAKDAAVMRRDLAERLDQIRERGETVVGTLEDRAKSAGDLLLHSLEEADAFRDVLRNEASGVSKILDERAADLREAISSDGSKIKRELETAARALRDAIAAGSAHRDTIERAAELAIGRAQAGVGEQAQELERLTRRAEAIVREHRETINSADGEIQARVNSAQDAVAKNLKQQLGAANGKARAISDGLNETVARAELSVDTQRVDEIVSRCELAKQSTAESINLLDEASTRVLADSEQARQSLMRSAEDIRGQASSIVERASQVAQDSTQQLDQMTSSIERAESWNLEIEERCSELDERVSERIRITMQEQSLAMAEQVSVLNDRVERAEAREAVLRGVVEAQNQDIASLRDMVAALAASKADAHINPEPELLIPVVRKATTRKKPAAKKKPTSKKAPAKKAETGKASTKKAAPKKASGTKKPAKPAAKRSQSAA
jgi:hypothetical protein